VLQAQAERQSGDHAAAELTCRAALETLKPLGRSLDLAHTYTQIGTNCVYRRDYDQAERYHRAALKVFQELGDLHGMKSAYNNLGTALMRADKLEAAIQSYQMSLEIKRRLGDRPGEGLGLNNLGNLWEKRGELRRAFQCYRRGVSIYRRLHRPRELTTLYYNMGEVQMRRGRLHNAVRIFARARRHATGIAGAYITQVLELNLGATQLALLDPQACLATLNATLPSVERSGLAGLLAQFHALMALAYGAVEDSSRAELHERLGRETLGKAVEDEEKRDTLLYLAAAALQLGRVADAERDAQAALELAERGARPLPRAQALRLLALTSQRRGDWDLAESRLERAVQICRELGFRHELSRCYKSLGTLHWDIGLRARAEEDFRLCVQLLEDLGLRHELGLTYLQLARLPHG
jgi:tetratricopeptide (TPR) repeat protein